MTEQDKISRRDFVKQTVAGTAMLAGVSAGALETAAAQGPSDVNKQVVAALGALFIPSKPGDPGYHDLESFGISDYILNGVRPDPDEEDDPLAFGTNVSIETFPVAAIAAFNDGAQGFFDGKTFLQLDETQRTQYLALVSDGSKIPDTGQRQTLQTFYRGARARILSVYYRNFPFHEAKRDANGVPILHRGDSHQITNPNVWKDKKVVTGWDIAGYKGPLDWEEEEKHRAAAKKVHPYWYEEDTVRLDPKRPPAATAIKTSDGHDYYDVVVLGGGTAGCMVAGRLAERGMNPKTGDRLRVVMIEGGDDWTIRDPGIRPGYGYPIRRQMITNIADGVGPEGNTPGPAYRHMQWVKGLPVGYNFKLIGGCSNHYGGTLWIPDDEDFYFYRQASGVDWDLAKFGDAIQEVREMFYAKIAPESWWNNAERMWADVGRSLGLEIRPHVRSSRNALGGVGGNLDRFDSKGTSLPWAYIGMNNGLKIIPNAEIQKIVIEKVPGGRPVARGAIYTDKSGTAHEVRAARVIVAAAANWTPLLLYQSGYGPKDILGDRLIVENKNVGYHMTGDFSLQVSGYLAEPMFPEDESFAASPWAAMHPRPWRDMTVRLSGGGGGRNPEGAALSGYAPPFGWEHKEYMRDGVGVRHVMNWGMLFGAVPWSWRVTPPRGKKERVEIDAPKVEAMIKQAGELVREWQAKMPVKVVRSNFGQLNRPLATIEPQHRVGTARAGSSRENSVCTSDFDCHDIDHLLFTSSATIPKSFWWSLGPTAVNAAYGWRRMLANHFSRGCSTQGFA